MNMNTEDYAWLAKDSYVNHHPDEIDNAVINLNGHRYQVFDYQASPSGFHATAYRQVGAPHDIVIAYRGTDLDHPLTAIQDVAVDAIMVGSEVNPQIHDAERFTERVLEKASRLGISPEHVTVAGHSLGGTLAEACAYKYNLHGQTFNAFGAATLSLGIPEGGDQVINNVLAGDPVSAAGHHFGTVHYYATSTDIDSLRAAGYLDGKQGVIPALHAMRVGDHSIDNFAPDPGEGPSVLTTANTARAAEYAPAIIAFRSDVHSARTGLHLAMQPSMPLSGLHATAWSVESLTSAGLTAVDVFEKASEALEREATRAAHAAEQAAHKVVEQTTQAYQATRNAVIDGVQTGERVIHDTYDAVREGVVTGVHTVENAAHQAAEQVTQTYQATRSAVIDGVQTGERAVHQAYDAARDGVAEGAHAARQAVAQGMDIAERAAQTVTERATNAFETLRHPGSWFDQPAAPAAPTHLDQPAHPGHPMFQQALHGVHQLDAERGRTPDQHSDNLAAALAVQARQRDLTRIDQVALSTDGERAFAVQHGGHTQYAHVQTADAVVTSVAQSSIAWQHMMQQKQQAQPVMEPAMPAPAQGMGR